MSDNNEFYKSLMGVILQNASEGCQIPREILEMKFASEPSPYTEALRDYWAGLNEMRSQYALELQERIFYEWLESDESQAPTADEPPPRTARKESDEYKS